MDDCIKHATSGWVHVKCPTENGTTERGMRTIEAGFNNVDYGSSFLQRLTTNGEQRLTPPPLHLTFDEEQDDDTKMPATVESEMPATGTVEKGSHKRPIKITQEPDEDDEPDEDEEPDEDVEPDEDEESDGGYNEVDDDDTEGRSRKRAKHEDTALTVLIDNSQGNYAEQKRTDEQMKILSHEPKTGDVVVVNALAGCGKTTVSAIVYVVLLGVAIKLRFSFLFLVLLWYQTIALLCDKIVTEHPTSKCLYLVYNKKAEAEASQSNKFPKENMETRTTHAYVQRHFFGVPHMHNVNPTGDYNIDHIIECLDLRRECQRIFKNLLQDAKGKKKLDKRVKVMAGYIRDTIKNFQASADPVVTVDHVFWRAKKTKNLTARTKWREKIEVVQYANWADQFFERVFEECINIRDNGENTIGIDIPHDAYLKVAQMTSLRIAHDFVFIDEAQDMTKCQADLFWGRRQRTDKITYLFGDRYQQIYRFRGASRSFRDMVDASSPKFTLSGSFRFGKNIADCATCVLKALRGGTLYGRSNDDGKVCRLLEEDLRTMKRGVVLCRTRNGIFKHLYANRPDRWCYLGGGPSNIPQVPKWQLDLESFIQGNISPFTYKGYVYESIKDIEDYIEDEGDNELVKTLNLLQFLVAQKKSIQEFYSDLRGSYSPMREGESPDEYDGLVMSTVHQAKGLEFKDVLIAADFRWKVIESAFLNRKIHCDEANILYVAITRSKCNLYLLIWT